jgi:hypothetical protein
VTRSFIRSKESGLAFGEGVDEGPDHRDRVAQQRIGRINVDGETGGGRRTEVRGQRSEVGHRKLKSRKAEIRRAETREKQKFGFLPRRHTARRGKQKAENLKKLTAESRKLKFACALYF